MKKHEEHNFDKKYFDGKDGFEELNKIRRLQEITTYYLISLLEHYNIKSVLDVGASEGYSRKYFEDRDIKYRGIDPYPNSDDVEPITIHEINDEKFDLIFYEHTLEHVENYREDIQKAFELLNKNGLIFIAVPHAETEWSYNEEAHINIFNEVIMNKLLQSKGFRIIEQFTLMMRPGRKELWTLGIKE